MSQRSKIELYNILKMRGGLTAFASSPYLRLYYYERPPFSWNDEPLDQIEFPKVQMVHYELRISNLGDEPWAYVLSGGVVIGQPFEWNGEHTLSDQPW